MNRVQTLLLLVCILPVCRVAMAGDRFDPKAAADLITPFVDQQTVLVAHVDLSKIDVAELTSEAARFLGVSRQEMKSSEQNRARAQRFVQQFTAAGADQLYVVASIEDLAGEKLSVVVPLQEGADYQRVIDLMQHGRSAGTAGRVPAGSNGVSVAGPFETCQKVGGAVFCGSRANLDRVRAHRPVERPELIDGFRAAGDTVAQAVLIPPEDSQRVLIDMLPRLPEQFGGVSGRQLAEGLQWAALGIKLPPKLAVRLTIQSASEEAARSTRGFITGVFGLAAQRPGLHQKIPAADDLLRLLTPEVVGDRLVIELTEDGGGIAALQEILGQPIAAAREKAKRKRSINQLRQLAVAMNNFASAFGGFAPAASYDRAGNKLLSWRVFMLPFLECKDLYEQFHLDEPWDSDHNKKLVAKIPYAFAPPSVELRQRGMTRLLAPVGENTMFSGKVGIALPEVTDGASKTILLVEVAPEYAVVWTKPDDWHVDFQHPLKGLLGNGKQFIAAYVDAAVRVIPKDIPPETLRRLLIRNDGKRTEGY